MYKTYLKKKKELAASQDKENWESFDKRSNSLFFADPVNEDKPIFITHNRQGLVALGFEGCGEIWYQLLMDRHPEKREKFVSLIDESKLHPCEV